VGNGALSDEQQVRRRSGWQQRLCVLKPQQQQPQPVRRHAATHTPHSCPALPACLLIAAPQRSPEGKPPLKRSLTADGDAAAAAKAVRRKLSADAPAAAAAAVGAAVDMSAMEALVNTQSARQLGATGGGACFMVVVASWGSSSRTDCCWPRDSTCRPSHAAAMLSAPLLSPGCRP
jgi:hypothetical protein